MSLKLETLSLAEPDETPVTKSKSKTRTVYISACKAKLIIFTKILETIFYAALIAFPLLQLVYTSLQIKTITLCVFFSLSAVLMIMSCYKFTCVLTFLSRYYGFLLQDVQRGIFAGILGFLTYSGFNVWYATLLSVTSIGLWIIFIMLIIQQCA